MVNKLDIKVKSGRGGLVILGKLPLPTRSTTLTGIFPNACERWSRNAYRGLAVNAFLRLEKKETRFERRMAFRRPLSVVMRGS